MKLKLGLYVIDFRLIHLSSADGASLALRDAVADDVSILVCFFGTFHEPIPVDPDQVESMEALSDSDQINSISKTLS